MNIKKIYRNISDQFLLDFEKSSEINHNGNIGDYRESALKDFLENGRLPQRFGIGKGEIVSSVQGVSKQSDLIIYDKIEGLSFEGKDSLKVFPVESICGVVEVKSCLSKEKLLEGLENIKSVKKLARDGQIEDYKGGLVISTPRPKPFGIIFSYKLGGNSLDSLRKNLKEWEEQNIGEHYTNLIVVLNEGIITHINNNLKNCIYNENILTKMHSSYTRYEKDALFQFYSMLIDLCARSKAGKFDLMDYFDPAYLVDDLIVKNHNKFRQQPKDGSLDNKVYKFNDAFIHKVYEWCQKEGKITHEEYYKQCLGGVPQNCSKQNLNYLVFLYNPDKLPPNDNKYEFVNGYPQKANTGTLSSGQYILINNEVYYIPANYFSDDIFEEETRLSIDDIS